MKKELIMITEEELFEPARKIFMETGGFDLSLERDQRMVDGAMKVWKDQFKGREVPVVIGEFPRDSFRNGAVELGNGPISCNIFKEIPEEVVDGVYAFTLTAGEHSIDSEKDMMGYVYADIWGTSYVEAASELLKSKLTDIVPDGDSLSPEFGPGYFGIPVEHTRNIIDILGGNEIGVRVNKGGLLVPQKSCASVYLAFKDFKLKTAVQCITCQGSKDGCKYCNIRKK